MKIVNQNLGWFQTFFVKSGSATFSQITLYSPYNFRSHTCILPTTLRYEPNIVLADKVLFKNVDWLKNMQSHEMLIRQNFIHFFHQIFSLYHKEV
jgi:hypothetical protein